jgi:hypothetical protein
VRVLVLAEPHAGAGHPDVGYQVQFVGHVPGIAVDHRDQRLGQVLGPGEGIEHAIGDRERPAGSGPGREGVHVDAAGEVLAVAEEHRRPQAQVVVEVVVRRPQVGPCTGLSGSDREFPALTARSDATDTWLLRPELAALRAFVRRSS